MVLTFELDFLPIDVSDGGATARIRERIRGVVATQNEIAVWSRPVTVEIEAWHVRPFDLDNVAKQVLDALCAPLAIRDKSAYTAHATLPDDDVRYVSAVNVRGALSARTCVRVRVAPTHSEETLRGPDAN